MEFRGKLVKNQLNTEHFECMSSMRSLYIGSTDYALFDNEDVSTLPMIPYILLNRYGLVISSENMEKWLEKMKDVISIINSAFASLKIILNNSNKLKN